VDAHRGQQPGQQRQVGVLADLPALPGRPEHALGRGDLGLEDARADRRVQLLVAMDGREEGGEQLDGPVVPDPALGAGLGDEVAAQRPGVGIAVGLDAEHELQRVDEEVDLPGPAPVEGGLGGLGRAGHGVEGHPVPALLHQH
jgi:hypothetical protein